MSESGATANRLRTLREAAEAVCRRCRAEDPVRARDRWYHPRRPAVVFDSEPTVPGQDECWASRIWDLIAGG